MRGLPPYLLGLFAGLSLLLGFLHAYNVNAVPGLAPLRAERHAEVISGTGDSPYVYRLLVPHAAEQLRRGFEGAGLRGAAAREAGYLVLRFLFTLAGLVLFYGYLQHWFDVPWALAGTFLFAALHPATYYHYWFQPASALDLVLWLAAARLAQTGGSAWWLCR